jgi:hypothetical protein
MEERKEIAMDKRTFMTMAILGALFLFAPWAAPAVAGETDMGAAYCSWNADMAYSRLDTGDLGYLSAQVLDREGTLLGRVVDVAVNAEGYINFLIVSPCLPGMGGDQLVAVPYSAFERGFRVDSVKVGLTREVFEGAPSFSSSEWPDAVRGHWAETSWNYFDKHI